MYTYNHMFGERKPFFETIWEEKKAKLEREKIRLEKIAAARRRKALLGITTPIKNYLRLSVKR